MQGGQPHQHRTGAHQGGDHRRVGGADLGIGPGSAATALALSPHRDHVLDREGRRFQRPARPTAPAGRVQGPLLEDGGVGAALSSQPASGQGGAHPFVDVGGTARPLSRRPLHQA